MKGDQSYYWYQICDKNDLLTTFIIEYGKRIVNCLTMATQRIHTQMINNNLEYIY